MNCLEFRQLALADPYDPALDAHGEGCQQCSSFRSEILDMDSDIEKALKVEVPEGLAARVLLNQSMATEKTPSYWVRYSMAASFGAALVFGALFLNDPGLEDQRDATDHIVATAEIPASNLASELDAEMAKKAEMDEKVKKMMMEHTQVAAGLDPFLAHAHHQPHDFYGSEHQPIGDVELERLMNQFEITASIDNVVYAAVCPFEGENAVHLVIRDTDQEQYTVMLLPDQSPGKMYAVNDDIWRGYVSPHPAGALAVLAEADDPLAVDKVREVADRMQTSIYLTADLDL